MQNSETPSRLESVDRALQLLIILRGGESISVKAAGERLDVAPSTAHRLLGALVARDFAVQDRERRYRAGPQLTPHGEANFSVNQLRQVGRPALQKLYGDINDTVQLMILTGPHIRFIDGIESEAALHVKARMGDLMPAYCSAGGKAILAELGNIELEKDLPRRPDAVAHRQDPRPACTQAAARGSAQGRLRNELRGDGAGGQWPWRAASGTPQESPSPPTQQPSPPHGSRNRWSPTT